MRWKERLWRILKTQSYFPSLEGDPVSFHGVDLAFTGG